MSDVDPADSPHGRGGGNPATEPSRDRSDSADDGDAGQAAEFDVQSQSIATAAAGLSFQQRVAVGCRGSANPAALAWLAEQLELGPDSTVCDVGAGLGGPMAWLAERYRCPITGCDPAAGAVAGARTLFGLRLVQSSAAELPFPDHHFDAALLLGVVSVAPEPMAALREARRIARRLGVIDYCSTTGATVHVGGSTFAPESTLREWVDAAGWSVGAAVAVDLPTPDPWSRAIAAIDDEVPSPSSEREVVRAVEDGQLDQRVLTAS